MDDELQPDGYRLMLRRTALARGWVDDEIARLRRRGEWTLLQRGAYTLGAAPVGRRARHVLAVRATVTGLRTPAVVSHASAAALHGLPLWRLPLDHVEITREPPARTDTGSRLRSHAARLPAAERGSLDGIPLTSPARTVIDLARSLPFAPALVVADAALFAKKVTAEQLSESLERSAGRPGARRARRVVAAADARSESVGESRSRALMIEYGIPLPDLQVEVRAPDRTLIGRTDFAWRKYRLLGEFDGRVKYGRLLRPGQDPGDAVWEEKQREDALRAEGWGVVRWIWRELDPPAALVARIRRQLSARTA